MLLGTMAAMASGCSSSGKSTDDTTFTYWMYNSVDASYYTDYNDNPALKYALSKMYGPENKQLQMAFWVPPAGTAVDNYQTMIGSGDYADIIENTIGDSMLVSYTNGISLDLTAYVLEYMPNYLNYIEAHPEIRGDAVTVIDGEDRYLGIIGFNEDYQNPDWGHMYRRDWIVQYGTHPTTGKAFTGGYTDPSNPDSWEDDVVFPSGGTDPIYISDWEWMFEIFEKAYADLGLTDSYCYSVPYNGSVGVGELTASFGGGASSAWFRDLDNQVTFGPVTEQFRSYIECMSTWYKNGWLDPIFKERVSDMFYAIDSVNVRQGKIGMWYGLTGQLGGRMDTGDALTSGISVFGCPTPINDIYGEEETKFKEPYCGFAGTLIGQTYLVTTAAEGKDLATLCSFLDFFYTEEGARIRSVGLSPEEMAEVNSDFYNKYHITEGTYTVTSDGRYQFTQTIRDDSGDLQGATTANKMPGIGLVSSIDYGYEPSFQKSLDFWGQFDNLGFFQGSSMMATMTEDENKQYFNIASKVNEYLSINVPQFIMGQKDIRDEVEWSNWCTMMTKYNYEKVFDIVQKYADMNPIIIR